MRGLLFTGGVQPDMRAAAGLFEPYSFVVAADSGLCGAEAAGIVPDIIVGDMDSVPDTSMLAKYPAEKIQIWPKDKDYTDTEIALQWMAKKHVDEVVLIGGSGGRMDHFFALQSLFEGAYSPVMWIGESSVVVMAEAGTGAGKIKVAGLRGDDPVSVFAVGTGPHACRSGGFHWDLDDLDWNGGKFSLSNRSDSGSISLTVVAGRFLLVVPLRDDIRIDRFT